MLLVKLLEHTPNPEHLVAQAAKQCYDAGFIGNAYNQLFPQSDEARIRKVRDMGHLSVFEHASFTFAIEGISRACSHQLVRFRVASFSQQSQRYCFLGEDFGRVKPPSIEANLSASNMFDIMMNDIGRAYNYFVKECSIPAEDARFVLPNACETNIIVTMNARELIHAFGLRCCTHAQWEIRNMFNKMLPMCREKAPVLFEKAGAPCDVNGTCPEGSRCCGKVNNIENNS